MSFSVSPATSLLRSYGHCMSTLRLCTAMQKRSFHVKFVRRSSTLWHTSVSTWLVSSGILFLLQFLLCCINVSVIQHKTILWFRATTQLSVHSQDRATITQKVLMCLFFFFVLSSDAFLFHFTFNVTDHSLSLEG